MPWQNVRKWLEDEIETKDKDGDSESLAEKLRAQISADDFAEEMEDKTQTSGKAAKDADAHAEEETAQQSSDKSEKQQASAPTKSETAKKPEKSQEDNPTMTTPNPAMSETVTYGIEEATELMRGLPEDHIELVALVVKRTLESTNVKVSTIIDDASRKQKRIDDRISLLKNEISKFEEEIASRKGEISTLENEGEEITTVKERLKLAEQLSIKESAENASSGDTGKSAKNTNAKGKKQEPAAKK